MQNLMGAGLHGFIVLLVVRALDFHPVDPGLIHMLINKCEMHYCLLTRMNTIDGSISAFFFILFLRMMGKKLLAKKIKEFKEIFYTFYWFKFICNVCHNKKRTEKLNTSQIHLILTFSVAIN